MMREIALCSLCAAALAACATVPSGPGVLVLPGSTKTFDQFRADEADCRGYASSQVGGATYNQAATNSAIASTALGTAIGAVAGAAMGGQQGAAAGAGIGMLGGAAAGSGAAAASGHATQQRYDFAYQQCMYAKGHKVPMAAAPAPGRAYSRAYYPPAAYYR